MCRVLRTSSSAPLDNIHHRWVQVLLSFELSRAVVCRSSAFDPRSPSRLMALEIAKNLELLRKNNGQGDIRCKKAAGTVPAKGHHYRLMLCAEVVVHVPGIP